jgi:hypothetical protein
MIRREETGTKWLIHQATHATIAGQIAEHWTISGVLSPREELLLAAHYHDAGWVNAERQLRVNGQGWPRTFTEMDLDEHFFIWQSSIDAAFYLNRYAGLLTNQHCVALYEHRLRYVGDPPEDQANIQKFLNARYAWRDDLIAALKDHPRYGLAVEPTRLAENVRLLQVWDYLSLLLCMSPVHEQTLEDVPTGNGQHSALRVAGNGLRGITLDPFPLDAPLTVWIDARQVIGGPFENDQALRQALIGVPYKPIVFEVGRG